MFDIGFWELLVIGVVGLLVIGPERLPGVARTIGLYVGKLQRFVAGVKTDIQQELDAGELRELLSQQDKQLKELQSLVNDTRSEVNQAAQQASDDIESATSKYHGIGTPLTAEESVATPPVDTAPQADSNDGGQPAAQPATAPVNAEDKVSKHA